MEHASRGRRSGNKGVGARWRGRFRIFSARHCSRTEGQPRGKFRNDDVVFFFGGCSGVGGEWEREHEGGLIRCAGRPREWSMRRRATSGEMARGDKFFSWRLLRCRRGILSHPRERPATHAAAGAAARGALIFCFGGALLPFVLRAVAQASARRWSVHTLRIAGGPAIRGVLIFFVLEDSFTRSGATRRGLTRFFVFYDSRRRIPSAPSRKGLRWADAAFSRASRSRFSRNQR